MNKATLKKLVAEYLRKGEAHYDAGKLTQAATDFIETEGMKAGRFDKLSDVYICEFCQRAYEPEEVKGVRMLKTFRGYTVDMRLQEFREMKRGKPLRFIPFTGMEGRALLY